MTMLRAWRCALFALQLCGNAQNIDSRGGDVAVDGGTVCKPECASVNVQPCPPAPAPLEPCRHGQCHWDGTSPFCEGRCSGDTVQCGNDRSGDGASCVTGSKALCCSKPIQPVYRCEVRVTAICGCGNDMVMLNCDDWRDRTCRNQPNTLKCSRALDAFQMGGAADSCSAWVDAGQAAGPSWMLVILMLSFVSFSSLGQTVWNINSGGGAVAAGNGIVCMVTCNTQSTSDQETAASSSDSLGGTSSESSSSGEGQVAEGAHRRRRRGRRLQSEMASRSETKPSTMCGCGNEWMQIDCEMYQNKNCRMSNTQSQSASDTGLQAGAGPKVDLSFGETVTSSNNQACESALAAFGSDENRMQTCFAQANEASSLVPSLGMCTFVTASSLAMRHLQHM